MIRLPACPPYLAKQNCRHRLNLQAIIVKPMNFA